MKLVTARIGNTDRIMNCISSISNFERSHAQILDLAIRNPPVNINLILVGIIFKLTDNWILFLVFTIHMTEINVISSYIPSPILFHDGM